MFNSGISLPPLFLEALGFNLFPNDLKWKRWKGEKVLGMLRAFDYQRKE
jgi:hypothetical protein